MHAYCTMEERRSIWCFMGHDDKLGDVIPPHPGHPPSHVSGPSLSASPHQLWLGHDIMTFMPMVLRPLASNSVMGIRCFRGAQSHPSDRFEQFCGRGITRF